MVSEMPGHSSVRITLEIYAHVQPDMQAEAVEKLDEMMRPARERAAEIAAEVEAERVANQASHTAANDAK
jgi:hypothetical protein